MNNEVRVLEIKTVQVQIIKHMITAIKDILTDTTIKFTKEGMKLINFDKTHTTLVDLMLYSDKFESYRCDPDQIIICANTTHLFKLISMMTNDDILTIYIDKTDYHDGVVSHLGLDFEDGDKNQCKSHKLRLIEPDTEELVIPDVEYSSIINIPTTDFQKLIRDLNNVSDRLEIKSVGNDLIFSCEGRFSNSRIIRTELDDNTEFKKKPDALTVIQGEFSLKSLCLFIKCTPLCQTSEMYLGNDLPLIIKYDVGSLGYIKLLISPLPSS
jgi:proliferating cell nuclear antigen